MLNCSHVFQVCFIPSKRYDNVWITLPLQLCYPRLCPHKRVLSIQHTNKRACIRYQQMILTMKVYQGQNHVATIVRRARRSWWNYNTYRNRFNTAESLFTYPHWIRFTSKFWEKDIHQPANQNLVHYFCDHSASTLQHNNYTLKSFFANYSIQMLIVCFWSFKAWISQWFQMNFKNELFQEMLMLLKHNKNV